MDAPREQSPDTWQLVLSRWRWWLCQSPASHQTVCPWKSGFMSACRADACTWEPALSCKVACLFQGLKAQPKGSGWGTCASLSARPSSRDRGGSRWPQLEGGHSRSPDSRTPSARRLLLRTSVWLLVSNEKTSKPPAGSERQPSGKPDGGAWGENTAGQEARAAGTGRLPPAEPSCPCRGRSRSPVPGHTGLFRRGTCGRSPRRKTMGCETRLGLRDAGSLNQERP